MRIFSFFFGSISNVLHIDFFEAVSSFPSPCFLLKGDEVALSN